MENEEKPAGISAAQLGLGGNPNLASGILYLPPAFDIIPRLLQLLDDPEADGESLADLIRLDAGLTADVLRVANSAAYAGVVPMDNLLAAVLRLGLRQLYQVVLEVVASPVFAQATQPGAASMDLWEHALRTALAAQILSRRFGEDAEVAFTAGLLHDLGKLVFYQLIGDRYVALLADARARKEPLFRCEEAEFRTHHAAVGGKLLKSWNFPENIVQCVAFHHDPLRAPKNSSMIVGIVYAANLLAHRAGTASQAPPYVSELPRPVLRLFGLESPKELWAFEAEVREAFEQENTRSMS